MHLNSFKTLCLFSLACVGTVAQADINLISGNGNGDNDSKITALAGSETGPFHPLTASDFASALTSDHAFIFNYPAYGWVRSLGDSSGAKWVGVDQNGYYANSHSALYAVSFDVVQTITNAQLSLRFSVDDTLGDANNEGVFIDGHALANSKSGVDWNGVIENKSFGLGNLAAGTHTLYFDVNNIADGPSSLIFNANIRSQAVPEPATYAALGLGIIGLIRTRKNRS